jgi:iron(III)-enterobactin esterase
MKARHFRSCFGALASLSLGIVTSLQLGCSSDDDAPGGQAGVAGTIAGGSGSGGVGGATGGAAGTSAQPVAGSSGSGGLPATGGAGAAGSDGGGAGTSSSSGAGGTSSTSGAGGMGTAGMGGGTIGLPDPGKEGDGDSMVGPTYTTQPDLTDRGNPKGKSFSFSMPLASSTIFDGKDATLDPGKVSQTRSINVYVPAKYQDGDFAPLLVIQDGPGEIGQVRNALDNLTISQDEARRLPPFVVIAVQNGGNDAIGSERGLEYDTLSDRYARFIELEVLPAVQGNAQVKAAYPKLKFTQDPSGRATLGCSSGGAAAFTMAWFRPDLFARVIAYSTTLVAQQDPKAPEAAMYPLGAWEYHSSKQLIANDTMHREKQVRIFLNVNENDLRSQDAESTHHNWVMANQRTAAALAAKGFHYKFVQGRGVGHCDGGVQNATLADALVWAWRGYVPTGR